MKSVRFVVPGPPRGKGRPRMTRSGHVYTDDKTISYEQRVWLACREAMGDAEPAGGAVEVTINARLPMPKSMSKRDRMAAMQGDLWPAKKPDLDNIVKSVLDGCNGVAYRDDSQVVTLMVRKSYGEAPGVHVSIKEV